jgi:hypothetical protein
MTTKLTIFNGALTIVGERLLGSLTENREPRRLLDQVWDSNGVKTCLEMGQWGFAMRTKAIDYDSGIEPAFGFSRVFDKPDDWVLTSALCQDEFFRAPLLNYFDEAGYWYSDLDTIYVRYVSDDTGYGLDFNKWPESFREFVEAHFASKIVQRITGSDASKKEVDKVRADKLKTAKSRAAMADATTFPARGSWGLSRQRFTNRRDGGGTTGSLIG